MSKLTCATAIAAASLLVSTAVASPVVLTFEGLQSGEVVEGFYSGGTGSAGSTGPDFGVTLSTNATAVRSFLSGNGSGAFTNNPSGDTVVYFPTGTLSHVEVGFINVAAGFDTGFSFYFTTYQQTGTVSVWSDLDGSGDLLATINLAALGSDYTPNATFDRWEPIGTSFAGEAKSVSFFGVGSEMAFDDITFGSVTPGTPIIPLPSAGLLAMSGLVVVGAHRRRRLP